MRTKEFDIIQLVNIYYFCRRVVDILLRVERSGTEPQTRTHTSTPTDTATCRLNRPKDLGLFLHTSLECSLVYMIILAEFNWQNFISGRLISPLIDVILTSRFNLVN